MSDIHAGELRKGMHIREYGSLHENGFTVAKIGWHGDTVLVTGTNGEKKAFGRNCVVQKVAFQPVITNERLRRMAKAPSQFPAAELRDALEELIARRQKD